MPDAGAARGGGAAAAPARAPRSCRARRARATSSGREIEHALIHRRAPCRLLGRARARRRARDRPRSSRDAIVRAERVLDALLMMLAPTSGSRRAISSASDDARSRSPRALGAGHRQLRARVMPPSRSPASSIASASSRRRLQFSGSPSTAALRISTDCAATIVDRCATDGVGTTIALAVDRRASPSTFDVEPTASAVDAADGRAQSRSAIESARSASGVGGVDELELARRRQRRRRRRRAASTAASAAAPRGP